MAQRQYFRVPDFSGGYNPDQDATLIQDNQAVSIRNFRLDRMGSLVSRPGWQEFGGSGLADNYQAIGRWTPQDNPSGFHILTKTDVGRILRVTGASETELFTGLDTVAAGEFVTFADKIMYVNGEDQPLYYDGTDAEVLGIDAALAEPTVAISATGGTLSGAYQYKYTYYDSSEGTESTATPASSTVNPSSQAVDVDVTASAESRVDQIRIYRTTDGGATFLLLDTTTNTTQTYLDDGSLALGTTVAPEDHDYPPVLEHFAYHKGYGFGSDGDTLYWSKALEVDYWPTLNNTEVPFRGNDSVRALISFQDTLLIFGRNNVLTLTGSAGNWTINRLDVAHGITNSLAYAQVGGNLVFLDYDGLRVFPGFQEFSTHINRELANTTHTELDLGQLLYVPEERAIFLTVNDQTYWIHVPNQAVSIYTLNPTAWLAEGGSGCGCNPLFIAEDGGQINEYAATTSDDGAAIDVQWVSKEFTFDKPELVKFVRRIGALTSQGVSAGVTIEIADREQTYTVTLASTATGSESEWDSATWDSSEWTSEGVGYFSSSLPAQTLLGRIVQITINASTTKELVITPPITLEYRESNRFL